MTPGIRNEASSPTQSHYFKPMRKVLLYIAALSSHDEPMDV